MEPIYDFLKTLDNFTEDWAYDDNELETANQSVSKQNQSPC